uniref:Uncharacterized protein n=1 Tax=Theropithecus gelada TaxID=9565 RepID=A0A8D2EI15_THEGE
MLSDINISSNVLAGIVLSFVPENINEEKYLDELRENSVFLKRNKLDLCKWGWELLVGLEV